MKQLKRILFFLALLLAGINPVHADRMLPISVEGLAAGADWILHGTVLSKTCQLDPEGRIYTKIDFEVSEVWKGNISSNHFLIVHGGGTVGEIRTEVSGQVDFQIGEEAVVYLVRNPRGEGVCIGLSQGKFNISKDAAGNKFVRNPFHGRGDDAGKNPPAVSKKITLVELRQRSQKGQP